MFALHAFALLALSSVIVLATAAAGPFDTGVKVGDAEASARSLLGNGDRERWIYDRPDFEFWITFNSGKTESGTVSQPKEARGSAPLPPRVPEGWSYEDAEGSLGSPSRKCEEYHRIDTTTERFEWLEVCFASGKVVTLENGTAIMPPAPRPRH